MRIIKLSVCFLSILVIAASAFSEDITFYSDGTVHSGDLYEHVYVLDTPPEETVVEITGGQVTNFILYHANEARMAGGNIDVLSAYDQSRVIINGGRVENVFLYNGSGGDITGGETGVLSSYGASELNISGGLVTEWLFATDTSVVTFDGINLEAQPFGGKWGWGYVTGNWHDSTPFTVDLFDQETHGHIVLIPEPATLSLLAFGSIALIRRKRIPQIETFRNNWHICKPGALEFRGLNGRDKQI